MITSTRSRLQRSVLAVAALAPIALGACGGDDGGSSAVTAPADATLTVEALNLKFDQKDYTVAAGEQLIAYLGVDSQKHTLLVVKDDQALSGKAEVTGGEVDTLDVTLEPGTYSLICDVPGHAAAGMTATLTVT